MTQSDEKMSCVHGLEESVFLKWPYYLRQSTDSMQSLSKHQGHFLKELEQIILKLVHFKITLL